MPDIVYCEFCGPTIHNTEKCVYFDTLTNILYRFICPVGDRTSNKGGGGGNRRGFGVR